MLTIRIMQSGAEQLREWMRRAKFSQAELARHLGFEESYVSVLLSGKRTPGLENAIKIERRTGVMVEAWASSELDESLEQAVQARAKVAR